MPDADAGTEILNLGRDFPPVSTETWEAAIAKDLKGADYEKKLVWRTEEGLAIRPYYRQEALAGLDDQLRTSLGPLSVRTRNGPGLGDRAECQAGSEGGARRSAARSRRARGTGIGLRNRGGCGAAGRVDGIAAGGHGGAARSSLSSRSGPTYFVEIAKLRAARMLWAQAVSAFGPRDDGACRMRLHVRTPRRNKSAYDRYTNLLRVTTEAFAAAVGGCDQLTVEPFGFDAHLALNVQRILKEESHLDAVADPAGGSYYIEALTDSLAREGWKLLQQTEAEGGYAKALASGSIEKALAETRAARQKAYSARRRALVGVNNFPDVTEKTPEGEVPAAEPGSPLPQVRVAEPFEEIRRRTTEHAQATGRYPKVLLLKRGDVKMKGARSNFCFNFFGCAGFDMVEAEEYAGTDADLIVLCSSDPEYLAFAQEVCPAVKVPVLVAGNPKEQIDALQAAGVQGFIHIFSDADADPDANGRTDWE